MSRSSVFCGPRARRQVSHYFNQVCACALVMHTLMFLDPFRIPVSLARQSSAIDLMCTASCGRPTSRPRLAQVSRVSRWSRSRRGLATRLAFLIPAVFGCRRRVLSCVMRCTYVRSCLYCSHCAFWCVKSHVCYVDAMCTLVTVAHAVRDVIQWITILPTAFA